MSTPPHWDLSNIYPSLEIKGIQVRLQQIEEKDQGTGRILRQGRRQSQRQDTAQKTGQDHW